LFGKEPRDKERIVNMFGNIAPDRSISFVYRQRYSFVVPEICDYSVRKIRELFWEHVAGVVEMRSVSNSGTAPSEKITVWRFARSRV
jgi:hypothetical protein